MDQIRRGKLFVAPISNINLPAMEVENWSGIILEQEICLLERQLAEFVGAPCCVSVGNAAMGFALALAACGVLPGEPVFCPALDCHEGLRGIAQVGARLCPVDINPNTLNLDAVCLEYAVKRRIRQKEPIPKAVVVTDAFGLPCNYEALEAVCAKHDITLIEDMTQSFGAGIEGRRTGSFGRFAVTSFARTAPLRGLEGGGAVFCHTKEDAGALETLRLSRGGARQLGAASMVEEHAEAQVVNGKLRGFEEELERRQKVAARYIQGLEGRVKTQQMGRYTSAYAQFIVLARHRRARGEMARVLRQNHIPFRFPVMNDAQTLPVNAALVSGRMLALPLHPYLSDHVVDFICGCVLEGAEATEVSLKATV